MQVASEIQQNEISTTEGTGLGIGCGKSGHIPERLSEAAVAQVVKERLAQFSHQPPVLIRDSEVDVGTVSDAVASGMVRGGKIYLFRDGMADTAEVTRTLWHEMLHCELRRFLTKEQYIASMKSLDEDDAVVSRGSWLTKISQEYNSTSGTKIICWYFCWYFVNR